MYMKLLGIIAVDIKETYQQMITCSETSIYHSCMKGFPAIIVHLLWSQNITHINSVLFYGIHHSSQYCFPLSILKNSQS